MINVTVHQKDVINIYVPNIGVPEYVKQFLTSLKGEI